MRSRCLCTANARKVLQLIQLRIWARRCVGGESGRGGEGEDDDGEEDSFHAISPFSCALAGANTCRGCLSLPHSLHDCAHSSRVWLSKSPGRPESSSTTSYVSGMPEGGAARQRSHFT